MDDDTGSPPARRKKPADRESCDGVREERAEALRRSRSGYIGQLTKNYRNIKEVMKSENFNDIDTVLRIRQKILNTFDNFERCCQQHLECLKEQLDIEEAEGIYSRELEAKKDIEGEIDAWTHRNKRPFIDFDLPLVEPCDSSSQAGSNESSQSSTATKLKLKARADQAVAELKIRQLKEEQELQERIEEMTMKLRLEEAIQVNKIKRRHTLLKAQHEMEQRNTELKIYERAERVELYNFYDDDDDVLPGSNPFGSTPRSAPKESTRVADFRQRLPVNPFATPITPISTNPFAAPMAQTPGSSLATPTRGSSSNPFTTTEWPDVVHRKPKPKFVHAAHAPTPQAWLDLNTPEFYVADYDNRLSDTANNDEPPKPAVHEKVLSQLIKQQERITSAMTNALMLPKPELLTFDGNPLHYWRFIRNYEQNIEAKTEDNGERLNYLLQYCTGKAKEVIKNCVVLDSTDGYLTARTLLLERFGEPYVIATAYIDLVTEGPPLRASDRQGLQVFADKLKDCELTLRAVGYYDDLNNADNLKKIAERFPVHLKARWLEKARVIRSGGGKPSIDHMSEFLSERAKAANDPVFGQIMDSKDTSRDRMRPRSKPFQNTPRPPRATTLATHQAETPKVTATTKDSQLASRAAYTLNDQVKCGLCAQAHLLTSCDEFKKKTQGERMKFVRDKGLCDNCLKRGHRAKNCYQKKQCEVDSCEGKHHTLLHPPNSSNLNQQPSQDSSNNTNSAKNYNVVKADSVNSVDVLAKEKRVCLPIVPVKVRGKKGQRSVVTYALLDQGSDTTLCEKRLIEQLGIEGAERTFSLTTIEKANVQRKGLTASLEVTALDSDNVVEIPTVWTVKKLHITTEGAPRDEDIRRWPHLAEIQIPEIDTDEVTLLIGNDTPEAFWALEEKRGQRKEPYAVKTLLGWTIVGPMTESTHQQSLNAHYISSHGDELKAQVERFWRTDFGDAVLSSEECMSAEDKRALSIMQESTVLSEGHYQMALPWRNSSYCTLNNRPMAEFRLATLKQRFLNDPGLYEKYKEVIDDHLTKGYARRLPNENFDQKRVWYLPHHAVITPKKLRVVFDCAAKWKGMSLNDQLLQGPDQTNNLVGVLTRFREEPIALAADIEAMFLQVKVEPKDCDMLRFLWWPDGDLSQQPANFQMLVHIFGATSSPSCANFALRKTADDNQTEFDDEIVNIVHRNFYVDDMLKSTSTVEGAIRTASEVTELLRRGGFRLTKWMSNSKEVLKSIPESERAKAVKELDFERFPTERALGVEWDVEKDCIGFKTQVKERSLTRRGMSQSKANSRYK